MKIMISGSMAFAEQMLSVKKELERLGHEVFVPHDIERHMEDAGLVDKLDEALAHATETDIMRKCFDLVAASDAVLVLNLPRKGINGYIGTSTLMEIGLAYYLRKKIFLYQNVPHYDDARWAHEITIMQPVILQGDLQKIA